MCLSQVYNINIVADTGSIRSIIIITKDSEFLADTHSCLSNVWNQIVWHTIWQLTNLSRRMCTYRIEISQYNALDGCTTMDIISYDLLINLLSIAIR